MEKKSIKIKATKLETRSGRHFIQFEILRPSWKNSRSRFVVYRRWLAPASALVMSGGPKMVVVDTTTLLRTNNFSEAEQKLLSAVKKEREEAEKTGEWSKV